MGFSERERKKMLCLVGVGPMVVTRLEEIGVSSLSQLAKQDPNSIARIFTQKMGLAGWHRTPNARRSMQTLVEFARAEVSQRRSSNA
jgi:predicted flap endonuclease-1-like 5' DNA nuclease